MNETIFHNTTCTMSTSACISNVQNLLVFTPLATKKIREFIGWKRYDWPQNRVERGGWLLGSYIRDINGNILQTHVIDILIATKCVGTPTYLEWPATEDIRLQREFFQKKEEYSINYPDKDELVRVGWWHTHPNTLPVFMSSTDMDTQRTKFFNAHDYSVVLNPHSLVWKAYIGRDAIEVPAIMLIDEQSILGKYCKTGARNKKNRQRLSQKAKKMCVKHRKR